MKLLAEPRAVIEKGSKIFMRYSKLAGLAACLERIQKVVEPARTGRKLRAAVLHGPRNLKLEDIPEEAMQQTQVHRKKTLFHVICQAVSSYCIKYYSFSKKLNVFAFNSTPTAA